MQTKIFILLLFLLSGMLCVKAQTHFDIVQHELCDSTTIDVVNHNPSLGYTPQMFTTTGFQYSWDFGNGQTSTNENPSGIVYTQPGTYNIDYSVVIDTVGFYLTGIDVSSIDCSDPFWGDPDPYIIIRDGSNQIVYSTQSSYYDNQAPPYYWSLNLKLNNPPYFVWVWDYDSADEDDNCVNNTESTPGASTVIPLPANTPAGFGVSFFSGTNGGLSYVFHYNKPVIEYSEQQSLTLFQSPEIPLLSSSGGSYSIFDQIPVMNATVASGNTVEWFDDSLLINVIHTGLTWQFIPSDTGVFHYWARQQNPVTGCISDAVQLTYIIFDPTDLGDEYSEADFQVFPNPATEFITLQSNSFFGTADIRIVDLFGRIQYVNTVDLSGQMQIDVSSLPGGMYHLVIQLSERLLIVKKLVILR